MKVQLKIIPDEPEELDHGLTFEMPAVPRVGDCLTISRPGQAGCSHFCVRGIRWMLDCAAEGTHHRVDETVVGTTGAVMVECEFEVGPYSSEEHKRAAPCAADAP